MWSVDTACERRPRAGTLRRRAGPVDVGTAYRQHAWQVYGFFANRLSSRTDAEDLTHLAFERALRAWPQFDARRSSLLTWLLVIARNLLIDHYRADRSRLHEPLSADGSHAERVPAAPGPETAIGLDPAVDAALGRLGQRERELLALRFAADFSCPEIARLTGLSRVNVQQIIWRSLRRLRTDLERELSG